MAKRVTIMKVSGEQKFMNVEPKMKFSEFLEQAGVKLDMDAKRVFMDSGVEVDDTDVIRENDILTITEGQPLGGKGKKHNGPQTVKIAVIGSGGVGKSAITLQYVQGRFVIEYDPTIEDAYRKQTVIDGKSCMLEILDTAGQEDYVALRGQWMQDRQGFILVYSVTDKRTFEDLEGFYQQLLQVHEVCPPVVIMGNKADMTDRAVQKHEGEQAAKMYSALFCESSAKTNLNIDTAFTALVREIRKRETPQKKRGFGCTIL